MEMIRRVSRYRKLDNEEHRMTTVMCSLRGREEGHHSSVP